MEELLANERAAEQNVHYLLKTTNQPILNLLQAFEEYRQVCQTCIFADFEHAAKREASLWHAHTEGKRYFHTALSGVRKQSGDQPVATRHLIKLYLQFIKESLRFYRGHIYRLNITFGGIPELEAVAQQVKNDSSGESSQPLICPELRKKILDSCHSTLIYLGDLSRYRASEKLDKEPDFGPAIGYYGLACTLRPSSGMGHHQQAVVALEQRNHLRAIYHLYRAMVVDEPHPNAPKNLKVEFDKTNTAWDKGELIPKAQPNDPKAAKRTLVGWFVRLHSMCSKGEQVRGYEELELEVLGQLTVALRQRSLGGTLMRLLLVNIAAQSKAADVFQENPTGQSQNAFIYFFRFNIQTFTTLLRVYYEDLRSIDLTLEENDDIDLTKRLTETTRYVLPALRVYSSWLLTVVHLVAGLSNDDSMKGPIDAFWAIYAKTVDFMAVAFPIWDLEDLPEITYLLEEDVDTLGFLPLSHDSTEKIWSNKHTGAMKAKFSDIGVVRSPIDDEMLARVKQLLVDGLFLANDDDYAPIKLCGTRILHRDAEEPEAIPLPSLAAKPKVIESTAVKKPTAGPKPKPLSYAAAAANGNPKSVTRASLPNGTSTTSSVQSRDIQLMRMVDDLVDDDDSNTPVTPPQQHSSNPVIAGRGNVSYSEMSKDVSKPYPPNQAPVGTPKRSLGPADRLQAVSNIWDDAPAPTMSSNFPSGLPTGTLSSPAQYYSRGHSRVNSASSIRSRTSRNIADSWSSVDSAPRAGFSNPAAAGLGRAEQSNVASPLLFGAGGGVWSSRPSKGHGKVSPPYRPGG